MSLPDNLYVGTSSWSCPDWLGVFYPRNLKPGQFLEAYARRFRAVEIDSTHYGTPPRPVVAAWRERTPHDFKFAAKAPGIITHERVLQNCQSELMDFLTTMELLGERLGPLVFQFPYFNRNAFPSRAPFERLLRVFLQNLPLGFEYALEICNKQWITWDFFELLREYSVAFVLLAQPWMPRLDTLVKSVDPVTADFCYTRFVGDPKAIGGKTEKWDKIIEDKTDEMAVWAGELKKIVERGVRTFAFFNNQYAGFAPGSVESFTTIWKSDDAASSDQTGSR
jgi:uncharacterized protein YecE (DUF72 family)